MKASREGGGTRRARPLQTQAKLVNSQGLRQHTHRACVTLARVCVYHGFQFGVLTGALSVRMSVPDSCAFY